MEWTPTRTLDGLHILLVEDDAIIGLDLKECLEASGATVTGPIFALAKAFTTAQSNSFDCAILDLKVIGGTIDPVADLLCEQCVPFVIHTGHGQPEALRRQWPACEVLIKPADYATLRV